MRMEKADILENVVKYMQTSHTSPAQTTSHDAQFRLGYIQCARDVGSVLEHLCGANSQIAHSMTHFLNIKMAQMTPPHLAPAAASAANLHSVSAHHTSSHTSPRCDEQVRAQKVFRNDDFATSPTSMLREEQPRANSQPTRPQHAPHTSAFQRVNNNTTEAKSRPQPQQQTANIPKTSSSENISIAVYQYNHYNNYRNDKQGRSGARAQSNINIRPPLIKVEAQATPNGDSDVVVDKCDDSCHDDSMWRPW